MFVMFVSHFQLKTLSSLPPSLPASLFSSCILFFCSCSCCCCCCCFFWCCPSYRPGWSREPHADDVLDCLHAHSELGPVPLRCRGRTQQQEQSIESVGLGIQRVDTDDDIIDSYVVIIRLKPGRKGAHDGPIFHVSQPQAQPQGGAAQVDSARGERGGGAEGQGQGQRGLDVASSLSL